METNRLKRFATEARNILMQGVAHRFTALGFRPDGTPVEEPQLLGGGATFMGDTVTEDFYHKWQSLATAIRRPSAWTEGRGGGSCLHVVQPPDGHPHHDQERADTACTPI